MTSRTPMPGTVLHPSHPSAAVVVDASTTLAQALVWLLERSYGGTFSATNPVIVAEAEHMTVQTWRSCTKAWKESNPTDGDIDDPWWSEDGDGAKSILVAWHPRLDLDTLGDRASAGEPPTTARA